MKNTGSNGLVFTGTIHDADGNVADIVGTQTNGKSTVAYRERFIFVDPSSLEPTSFAECSLTQRQ